MSTLNQEIRLAWLPGQAGSKPAKGDEVLSAIRGNTSRGDTYNTESYITTDGPYPSYSRALANLVNSSP